MKYVNTIRRIMMLDNAIDRIPFEDRYAETEDRLWEKRKELARSIREYTGCPDRTNKELRHHYYGHRKQVKLACKLLGVDYIEIVRYH